MSNRRWWWSDAFEDQPCRPVEELRQGLLNALEARPASWSTSVSMERMVRPIGANERSHVRVSFDLSDVVVRLSVRSSLWIDGPPAPVRRLQARINLFFEKQAFSWTPGSERPGMTRFRRSTEGDERQLVDLYEKPLTLPLELAGELVAIDHFLSTLAQDGPAGEQVPAREPEH